MIEQRPIQVREDDIHTNDFRAKMAVERGAVMHRRIQLILLTGFGGLLAIIALLGIGALREARRIYADSEALHAVRNREAQLLADLRADILRSGIVMRDYLLDISLIAAPAYREQLRELRNSTDRIIEELAKVPHPSGDGRLKELSRAVEEYMDVFDPVFEWTPKQKLAMSSIFLRTEVLPRRRAVAELTDQIRKASEESLRIDEARVRESHRQLRWLLARLTGLGLALGVVVAGLSIWRISHLEKQAALHLAKIERGERELRNLSHQLVRVQEEERKRISRELHDEVGQMLTALRLLLNREATPEQVEEARHLTEQSLKTVREIAMRLRPSMLDDLGLGAAVEWLAREVSRRAGVPIHVEIDGALQHLPDGHRTAIFRIVQEALTNCVRHAGASNIRVLLHGSKEAFTLLVQDDGVGFEPGAVETAGLGILGMKERAAELGGDIEWISKPGKGTQVRLWLPLAQEVGA